ncbi:MAG: translocation/assembly module TamB domain-containing protein [Polyangiales bacterium]
MRALVRGVLERLLDDVLAGDVQLDRIAALSLGGVVVEGVTVHDPRGAVVLHATRLTLGLDPRALLGMRLRFTHGLLDGARIRAIPSETAALTLFEALSPPPAPGPKPPPAPGGLDVVFEHIHVTSAQLYGDVPGLAGMSVEGLEARGDVRVVDATLHVRVTTLRGAVVEPFLEALSIDHATFALVGGEPLRMWVSARASHDADRVHVKLAYRAPEVGDDHLDLLLGVAPLSPELLRDLGVTPAQILLSTLRGHARLSGPLRALSFAAAFDTDGGPLALRGRAIEQGPFDLRVDSGALELSRLIGYAPPVALRVGVDVHGSLAGGPVRLALQAPELTVMELVTLRDLDVAGVYDLSTNRLTFSRAHTRWGGGHLDVSGWVDGDADFALRVRSRVPEIARDPAVARTGLRGGLRTDVRLGRAGERFSIDGSIGVVAPSVLGITAKEAVLEGTVESSDAFTDARIDLRGSSWGTAFLDRKVGDIDFHARGTQPRFAADFALIDNKARTASAHLALTRQKNGAYHVLLEPLEIGVQGRDVPWRAHADLTLDGVRASLNEVWLAKGAERLSVSGHYAFGDDYRVDALLSHFDLGGLRKLSGLDLSDLDGTVEGKLALTGRPGQARIEARASVRNGLFLGMEGLALDASLTSVDDRFDVDAALALADGSRVTVYAGGEPGSGASWSAQLAAGTYQFGLDFVKLPFEVARPWLAWIGIEPPPGTITAELRGAGTLHAPSLTLSSRVQGLTLPDVPPLDIELSLAHDGTRTELQTLRVADPHGELGHAEGALEARLDELLDVEALRAQLASRALSLTVGWKNRRLDQLPGSLAMPLAMASWGDLTVRNEVGSGPTAELSTRLAWPDGGAGIDACGTERHPELTLLVSARDGRATAKLTGKLDDEQLAMGDVEADTPLTGWLSGAVPLAPPRTSFTLNAATEVAEEVPGLCELLAGPLKLEVSALDAFADPPELRIALSSDAMQLVTHPSQRQRLGNLRDVRTVGRPFAVHARAGVDGPSLVFDADLAEGPASRLALAGSVPRAALVGDALERATWPRAAVRVSARALELSPLLVALPFGVQGSGTLDGDATAEYDFAADRVALAGALTLSRGKIGIGALGQELSDVRARLTMHDQTLVVEELRARDFDGRATLKGELGFAGLAELHTDLALTLADFPIRRESAQVSRLTGALRLRATTTAERTRAELDFGELRVNLPNDLGQGLQALDAHPDIAVRGQVVTKEADDPHVLELRLLAQNPPIRVLRSDLSADVAGDLTVRYADALSLSGAAEIKRGSFELYGKRFELDESRVAFDGGEGIDPLVMLHALHRTGGDEIGVRVEGRLSEPKISFTHSNPAITDTGAILAQLLGARRSDPATANQDATTAAAGILAGATAGLLTQGVRQEFGGALPVLSLESNSQTLRSARIRAGLQLDQLIERRLGALRHVVRGAYVEGFVAPGAAEDNALNPAAVPQSRGGGLLELRFPRDLVGTVEYRPVQNWRLDLAWEP